jgi:hypothetical protein
MRSIGLLLAVCGLGLVGVMWSYGAGAPKPATVEVALELTNNGNNYDDPCFWQDPLDAKRFLVFMTSKSDDLVDVWEMPSRRHVAQITGFATANNCDVDQAKNLLLTTDPEARQVRIHSLPELHLVSIIRHDVLREPSGVAVGHTNGKSYAFVTDEDSKEVHVFTIPEGTHVKSFRYHLRKAEGISTDDDLQRVYVSDDKSDDHSTKAFTFDGTLVAEFGVEETGSDTEGNAVYRCGPRAGYIVVSDQRQSRSPSAYSEFEVFDRETFAHVGTFRLRTSDGDWTGSTDGIDIFQGPSTEATGGVFAACDGCGGLGQSVDELDIVGWDRIATALDLQICPNGEVVAARVREDPAAMVREDPAAMAREDPPDTKTAQPPQAPKAERPVVQLSGTRPKHYRNRKLEPHTILNARDVTFLSSPENKYPLNLGGGEGLCVLGGTVLGQYDRTWDWDRMHDTNNAAIAFENKHAIIDGLRADNVTDGVRPRPGTDFVIRNIWLSHIRDDCIENDHLQGGVLDNSLLDGCYTAFSARPSRAKVANGWNGSQAVWTIQNSLVRLEPMPGPRGKTKDGLGHGTFFKWHSRGKPYKSLSPKLVLYNNIFMAERVGQTRPGRMGTPPEKVVKCENNVMVWLGPGPFPAKLPSCFRVTKDRAVWDRAVAEWTKKYRERMSNGTLECSVNGSHPSKPAR